MNILIVGNGFDLSHYLPTKYDHFMVAMAAIEDWNMAKGDMSFDDLFQETYYHTNEETGEEWQNYFFQYTKAMYKTNEIKISVQDIEYFKQKLKDNVWYQYFSEHVKVVKTWIDFELKIKEALQVVCDFMICIEQHLKEKNTLSELVSFCKSGKYFQYFLSQNKIRSLDLLSVLKVNYHAFGDEPYSTKTRVVKHEDEWQYSTEQINYKFIQEMKGFEIYKYKDLTQFLRKNLLEFSKIFNEYLQLFDNLSTDKKIINPLVKIDKVYSFNYTSTYSRFYDLSVNSYYLHGKLGEKNNLVLGVSDLENNLLNKFNLWGFTKYHQKLFFDVDYQFIDHYMQENLRINQIVEITKEFRISKCASGSGSVNWIQQGIQDAIDKNSLDINFYIWGHSLDESDRSYIEELFSFNEIYDQNVRITIYYFNDDAKYDLLANLINILSKEKIENWMKKVWLKFEKNPDIDDINNVQPIQLHKKVQETIPS